MYFAVSLERKAEPDSLTNPPLVLMWPSQAYFLQVYLSCMEEFLSIDLIWGLRVLFHSILHRFHYFYHQTVMLYHRICIFPVFNHLCLPSRPLSLIVQRGMQWAGASILERCKVASSPLLLISQPCCCHLGNATFGLPPVTSQPPGPQINKPVSLLSLILCILPVRLLCFVAGVIDSVGWVVH